jgi:hypothetical protein
VDLDTDVLHCGMCDNPCTAPVNGVAVCDEGSCTFSCDPGFDDCDGNAMNGCEADLTDPATCGDCTTACARPNTVASCDMGACNYVCETGFGDCDADGDNGCEDTLDSVTHCGACGVSCAPAGATGDCSTGTCMIGSCTAPFDDCDGDVSNACEANLAFDESDCGTCGTACASGGICNGGDCYADCEGVPCMSGCSMSSPCMCNSGTCGFFCSEATCDTHCQGSGISCTVLGNGSRVTGRCTGGATCTFDLRAGDAAQSVRCDNASTTCSADCRDAASCQIDCRSGADCEILCSGTGTCGFNRCDDMETDCGGGRHVCNPTGSC